MDSLGEVGSLCPDKGGGLIVTDKTNVITVTAENLEWINKNVPGRSKRARLEHILVEYKKTHAPAQSTGAVLVKGAA